MTGIQTPGLYFTKLTGIQDCRLCLTAHT